MRRGYLLKSSIVGTITDALVPAAGPKSKPRLLRLLGYLKEHHGSL